CAGSTRTRTCSPARSSSSPASGTWNCSPRYTQATSSSTGSSWFATSATRRSSPAAAWSRTVRSCGSARSPWHGAGSRYFSPASRGGRDNQMPDTDRRVALVTGGSRGIGHRVVTRLAGDGFDVAFCYKSNQDAADLVAKEATAAGAAVLAEQVDVAERAEV